MWSRARPKGGLGTGGSARCHMLLLVLVPVGSYREVGDDPASRAGSAPKGLAESGDTTAAIQYMLQCCAKLGATPRYLAQTSLLVASPSLSTDQMRRGSSVAQHQNRRFRW